MDISYRNRYSISIDQCDRWSNLGYDTRLFQKYF